jgi:hypothetical protein
VAFFHGANPEIGGTSGGEVETIFCCVKEVAVQSAADNGRGTRQIEGF